MATETEIKNAALIKLGVQPVTDYGTSTSKAAEVVNNLYPLYKRGMLSRRRWTFASKRLGLINPTAVVDETFQWAFDLPSDFLNLNSVYPDKNYINSLTAYEIRGNKIYANVEEIFIKYMYEAPEEQWTAYFTDFFKVAFASEICFVLTGDKTLNQLVNQEAFGTPSDNLKGGLFGVASRIDAQQNPVRHIQSAPVLESRHSGISYRRGW